MLGDKMQPETYRSSSRTQTAILRNVLPYLARVVLLPVTLGAIVQPAFALDNPPADRDAGAAVSQEECLNFAHSLEKAVKDGDSGTANRLIDWKALSEAATDGLGMPDKERANFGRGVIDALTSDTGFITTVHKQVIAGGSYRFIRCREMGGRKTVLFRLINQMGFNYHEFRLRKQAENVQADDVYIYLAGEKLSKTLRRSAIPFAQHFSRNWFEKLTQSESEYIKHIDKFQALSDALRAKRYNEALRIYAGLPEALQKDKMILLMRYQAASQTSGEEVLKAAEDFRRFYPNDICLDFLLIDFYTLRKEHDKALESIDRLDKSLGGDAFLNSRRADMLYAKHETAKAYELVEKAIADSPDLVDPYWTLAGISLMEKDHARTLDFLQRIEKNFKLDLSGVGKSAAYAEFARSPQGQEWLRAHQRSANPVEK
jgi:tetratricopeptide (TPR) repeat protein